VRGTYDVLLTLDQNLLFQQNLRGRRVAVLVLSARSNRIQDLLPHVAALVEALPRCRPGEVTLVGGRTAG
jgi:hypothetical protein